MKIELDCKVRWKKMLTEILPSIFVCDFVPPEPEPKNEDILINGNKIDSTSNDISFFIKGMDVRLLANDEEKFPESKGGWYFIDSKCTPSKICEVSYNDKIEVKAFNFISSRSSLKYKFYGWTLHTSDSKIISDNPLMLSHSDLTGTLRGYWNTIHSTINRRS